MPTDFMVTVEVEEVYDLKGRYKVVLNEVDGVIVFCDTGSEVFGVIYGFYQKGQISIRHPFEIMTGPLIDQSGEEFQARYREGEKLRKEYELHQILVLLNKRRKVLTEKAN